jgi:superfamily II DNA or RNA helicase
MLTGHHKHVDSHGNYHQFGYSNFANNTMSFHSLVLDDLRKDEKGGIRKTPFEHQLDAFGALKKCFDFDEEQGKGGLLVLPTGAGKTFTTVKWVCDNVVPRNIRVLWLANSYYLLDQAFREFHHYARWIPGTRETLNIRLVSSNPSHDSPSSILLGDDVVVMTTPTAIKNLNSTAEDKSGNKVVTHFRKWIEEGKKYGLFVVLDEAHHAPAHGCRHLLIGTDEAQPGIRAIVKRTNLLGLTATPTYSDMTRKGWLGKIFEAGIIYQADKKKLTAEGILSRPHFIPRPTGNEIEVPDDLYNRLVRQHMDLPEDIIDKLARNSQRNDAIVQDYVRNKELYGKSLIFADRWFQCVYLKTKLLEKGIKADAVYSRIDADPDSVEGRNQRTASDNERILNEFRTGKDKQNRDTLDVLINVRMLTEGADVPSVRTVFLTRQTTSEILMTQMIGRALRGRKAGGADEANIVMFFDEWKRLIDWVTPASLDGGTEEGRVIRGYYPYEYVSIRLVEELSRQINSGGELPSPPFSQIMPTGWFQTEFVVTASGDGLDETQAFVEFVMVYEDSAAKFEMFMKHFLRQMPEGWDREFLSPEWMKPQVAAWVTEFFDRETDDIGNSLDLDLIRIARHIAQKQAIPAFNSFEEREKYDLDAIARKRVRYNSLENYEFLQQSFKKTGSLWQNFYKSYERFATAFDGAMRRILHEQRHGSTPHIVPPSKPRRKRELSEEEKAQVKKRDGNQCLCCGAKGKGIRLQIDHIIPYNLGGETSVENLQTLCSVCNRGKKENVRNFLQTATELLAERELEMLSRSGTEDVAYSIARLVNSFYRCRAVCHLHIHQRSSGQFYSKWEIELYSGNDPKWLNKHKKALMKHIQEDFGCDWVKDITIVGAK